MNKKPSPKIIFPVLFIAASALSTLVLESTSILAMASGEARATPAEAPTNFLEVKPDNRCSDSSNVVAQNVTIYRGAAPDDEGNVQFLSNLGIKSIVNLEQPSEINPIETSAAKSLNISELLHPMPGLEVAETSSDQYDHDGIISAVAELNNSSQLPIYVHCKHGDDRTGMVIALHRVFHECWAPKDAEKEWRGIAGWWHDMWGVARFHYFHLVTQDSNSSLYQKFSQKLK